MLRICLAFNKGNSKVFRLSITFFSKHALHGFHNNDSNSFSQSTIKDETLWKLIKILATYKQKNTEEKDLCVNLKSTSNFFHCDYPINFQPNAQRVYSEFMIFSNNIPFSHLLRLLKNIIFFLLKFLFPDHITANDVEKFLPLYIFHFLISEKFEKKFSTLRYQFEAERTSKHHKSLSSKNLSTSYSEIFCRKSL